MARHHRHPSNPRRGMLAWARPPCQRLGRSPNVTGQPVTTLTPSWRVIMARHHRSVEPQARQACYGRDQPVNDSDVTERDRHRPLPGCPHGASSSIRRTPPQARQGCYGRGHPVNDSGVTDQPATVLTVVMARHHRSVEPHPRRGKLAMEATTLSTTRTSPNITGHRAGGRRGASSAFAEPLTVHSLASAATLSTAPTGTPRGITSDAA